MEPVSSSEYFSGFVFALAKRGVKSFTYDETLHLRLAAAFSAFKSKARAKGLKPSFDITLDPTTKHSGRFGRVKDIVESPLMNELSRLIEKGLLTFGTPTAETLIVNVSEQHADLGLQNSPGGASPYIAAADLFINTR